MDALKRSLAAEEPQTRPRAANPTPPRSAAKTRVLQTVACAGTSTRLNFRVRCRHEATICPVFQTHYSRLSARMAPAAVSESAGQARVWRAASVLL